ncbi:helix-turn-helix transcriptional regulator [Bacillus albus]|uniref:helix-turn-helix domain-containing protein n=1 Tax=Bacillus TaxID=1386 RepID=UPI00141981C2|nr:MULTISPECIES: helix-turn-helix transcriptional regulator [Bacillus]MBU5217989.1 helix-turn-helix domain-containing protein [Bacillus albus]MDA2216220.1 helix-turn-helix transcriptional regulator [Bacillus cereus group sp. Bc228]MDA2227515.1 helix-turn-helix transcriptional regulator [Bacillus cereus group sp. Bc227]MDA2264161.1 helix-turn-helix transcriptional regulator [Bacillus cereus group sp. Bc200]MDA2321911.1 helix-turn-helix transcriptional regulator [Bacillus cereus group sp. Bc177]
MIFSERLKEEREKRNWSQSDLSEKIHVSRQSVSKWETGKNYPSIEIIIHLSDLFGITIDELLRSDEELTQKVIEDSKQLAYPKWKVFFDSLFMMGVFLFITKIVVWILNKFAGANITIIADAPYVMNVLPLILMVIGGTASNKLKKIYK